jgi:hypothetical protein
MSRRRFAVWEENGPPASEMDCPNRAELMSPTGGAKFSEFNKFRAEMESVTL